MILTSLWPVSATSPASGPCRVEFKLGAQRVDIDAADAADVSFERASAVRSFPAWKGKRHYSGLLWLDRLRQHVEFESLAERLCLIELDRETQVAAVSSQPMWIRWCDGTSRAHAPDYFARLHDGGAVVIDVRPERRIDERARCQFDRTAVFCEERGWRYVVYAEDSRVRDANLRFLLRYRHPHWRSLDILPRVRGFQGRIHELVALLDDGDPADALARCYALMWSGELVAELDQPLSMRTEVRWEEVS